MNQSGFHRMSPDFRTINTLEVKPTIKRIVFWNCWCTYLPKQCRLFSLDVCIRGLDLHYGGAGIYRSGCPHGALRGRFRRVGSFLQKKCWFGSQGLSEWKIWWFFEVSAVCFQRERTCYFSGLTFCSGIHHQLVIYLIVCSQPSNEHIRQTFGPKRKTTTLRIMRSQNWWFGDPKEPCYTGSSPSFLEVPIADS